MPATITTTGSAVAFSDTARPAMMFVAWPVSEALAMLLTGRQTVPVKYSVIATSPSVTASPMSAQYQ